MTSSTALLVRLGTISYVVWALLHLMAAAAVFQLGLRAGSTVVGGRLLQDAWNLAAFSVAGAGIAIGLNWRNSVWGYWINLAIVGVADVGFILFVLVPGYMSLWPGIVGPIFWPLGLILTSYGRLAGSSAG